GQIFYLFNAQVPVRHRGDWHYWRKTIPGDTATTLWTRYHTYQDLPRLVNPPNGWLQNANDPPWTVTFPQILDPDDYPSYLAPKSLGDAGGILRPQRSIRMLREDEKISFEEMISYKFSSRMELADRLLDDLIPAARELGDEFAQEAADVLEVWDRQAEAKSQGAVLFALWVQSMEDYQLFATPWQSDQPLTTPDGLADPRQAVEVLSGSAAGLKLLYGNVAVPWGEVVRLRYGEHDLPASGSIGHLGSFRVLYLEPGKTGRFQSFGGDSYIAAVEFSHPLRAQVLNTYGNATQPHSPHRVFLKLMNFLPEILRI
ncbi:MAG: acylase, partial [Okeania sp. SIO2D1]|nr:acylase [Okeania sp. SIO2D1]